MDNTQTKAAGTGIRAAGETSLCKPDYTAESLLLLIVKDIPLVDSRILAAQLRVKHASTLELILRYENEFREIDQIRFKTGAGGRVQGGGNGERFALLSEDQAFFLLTLSRNSERVVPLKMRLVQAFHLVVNRDAVPLKIHVSPAHTGQFLTSCARQQQALQVSADYRVADLLHGGEPCVQLLSLQAVRLGVLLRQCILGDASGAGILVYLPPVVRVKGAPVQKAAQQAENKGGMGRAALSVNHAFTRSASI